MRQYTHKARPDPVEKCLILKQTGEHASVAADRVALQKKQKKKPSLSSNLTWLYFSASDLQVGKCTYSTCRHKHLQLGEVLSLHFMDCVQVS